MWTQVYHEGLKILSNEHGRFVAEGENRDNVFQSIRFLGKNEKNVLKYNRNAEVNVKKYYPIMNSVNIFQDI